MKILSVVGARPNFMKIAPFMRAIEEHNRKGGLPVRHLLVHTGQHYDHQMSQAFFDALGIPEADIHLGVGSGTHAEQVGNTMIRFEKVLLEEKPDWVVVVGDVNATLACSVSAKKLHVKCCHIEAGLRSGDWTMPEEINRMVTDRISDLLLTPDELSVENLRSEGIPDHRIGLVGNIMIDTLKAQKPEAEKLGLGEIVASNLLMDGEGGTYSEAVPEIRKGGYAVLTLHRPSNVDHRQVFASFVEFLTSRVTGDMPLLWPIHPRARKQLQAFGLWEKVKSVSNLVLLQPVGYHEMLRLNMDAAVFFTDSGGLQQECAVLGTPCLTLRANTEWSITLKEHGGAGVLVGDDMDKMGREYDLALSMKRRPIRPAYWDGKTAQRCLNSILDYREPGQPHP